MNLAQDFSPGMALRMTDLVPEARLSRLLCKLPPVGFRAGPQRP